MIILQLFLRVQSVSISAYYTGVGILKSLFFENLWGIYKFLKMNALIYIALDLHLKNKNSHFS
jgi:hypothetical protein